jgi:predicted DNA-binding transcriptional regulator AlpA
VAIKINGQMYYRTLEACQMAGVSRATLFRWLKAGILEDVMPRDRKGWRLFTESDVNRIKSEATRVISSEASLENAGNGTSQESVRGGSYEQENSGY